MYVFQLLQQGYRYHKLRKTFYKFYRRHYELIFKYNVGLKTLLSEGLPEPEFYDDLVYSIKTRSHRLIKQPTMEIPGRLITY